MSSNLDLHLALWIGFHYEELLEINPKGKNGKYITGCCPIPGANIKEFLVTILSEAKWPQIPRLS